MSGAATARRSGGGPWADLRAGAGAGAGDLAAGRRQEAPVVAARLKGQFEDAPGAAVADLTAAGDGAEAAESGAPGPDHELADPRRIGPPVRVERREALVIVVVPVQDERRVRGRPGAPRSAA